MTVADIPAVAKILRAEFRKHPAPIVEFLATQEHSPFKILVATILSARTKDTMTAKVVKTQLFPQVSSFDDLRKTPLRQIEKLIFPVGFYRQKAVYLKQLPDAVDRLFGGKIPETVEELVQLPGVGRKTANLVVAQAFNKPGVCVDVHVHRICNRLGLVRTKTPFETEMRLRKILPEKYWIEWNGSLVSFGQRRCLPRNPKCDGCPIGTWCMSFSLCKSRANCLHSAHEKKHQTHS